MDDSLNPLYVAIQAANYKVIVSIVLVAIAAYVKYIVEKANVKGLPLHIVSVVCSYIGGVAILLPAVSIWWFALFGAFANPTTSNGLRNIGVAFVKWTVSQFRKK